MGKFKVESYMPGAYQEKTIECGRLEIRDNCYCFWTAVYGESNRLIAAYPIQYTIVTEIFNKE